MAAAENYDGQILLSTFWNQEGIIQCGNNNAINFNDYAPLDPLTGARSDTGCTNTAMGQIIYYFLEKEWIDFNLSLTIQDKYVSLGNSLKRMVVFDPEGNETSALCPFEEINEALSVFVPEPTDPEASDYSVNSEAAAKFIAALNLACGVINKSKYSSLTGTEASPEYSLFERSGFTSFTTTESFSDEEQKRFFTKRINSKTNEEINGLTEEFIEVLITNLLDGRPVFVGIPGHAIVLDGYDSEQDKFHFNYGWGDPSENNGGPGGAEGTAEDTRWFTRQELLDQSMVLITYDLQGSYTEEFTVKDARYYGAETFLHAVDQANAMRGSNVISFVPEETAGGVIEITNPYQLEEDVTIRDFNLTIYYSPPQNQDEESQPDSNDETGSEEEKKAITLFENDPNSRTRFENFNGSAVLLAKDGENGSIFDFSNGIRTELFFNGAKFYAGKYNGTIDNAGILAALDSENISTLLENTDNVMVLIASAGDNTIKFDQACISVGNIDLGDGHNKLIIAGGSQIFGDISGNGQNSIVIDTSANMTGALLNETQLHITIEDANSEAVFDITGETAATVEKIISLTIDASGASAGDYILFSGQDLTEDALEQLQIQLIGNGDLAVADNQLVLTVTEDHALQEWSDEWKISSAQNGNIITLSCPDLGEEIAGYAFRYAKEIESLAGNGTETQTNAADLIFGNGSWYFQVRAFDHDGTYSAWSDAAEVVVNNTVETITDSYLANGTLTDQTFDSNYLVLSGGQLIDTTVSAGTLSLSDGSTLTGNLTIAEGASVDVYSGASFLFDVSALEEPNPQGLINDFSAISGTFHYTISVAEEQAIGSYILAENVEEWDDSLKIKVNAGKTLLGTFEENKMEFIVEDKAYSLVFSKEEKQLQLVVEDSISTETAENGATRLRWNAPAGASGYIVELSDSENFESSIRFIAEGNEVNIITPVSQAYSWRTLTTGYDSEFTFGGTMQAAAAPEGSTLYTGINDEMNIFMAKSSGVWEAGYAARYMSSDENLDFSVEDILLDGKNRYQDIFQGGESDDSKNILYLSDDENGDAFFADDIYSAFPDEQSRIRFSNISNIYAGAGNDIIDMTSTRFETENAKIYIHGGDGDDVIWAADDGSCLFGDAGNDIIIGSSGNDFISGGAGDDKLYSVGGVDHFIYGLPETWGNDEIFQLEGSEVKITFFTKDSDDFYAEHNISTTYDPDANITVFQHESGRITIYGQLNPETLVVSCRDTDELDKILAANGFDAYSSRKIFEDASGGMLA